MSTAQRQAARSLLWTALESFGLSGLSLLSVVVLARLLSPTDFGLAALALGVVQILSMLVEMFFHDAVVQRRDLERAHVDSAFTVSLTLGLLLTLATIALAPLVATLLSEPRLPAVLRWMCPSIALAGLSGVLVADLRRRLAFRALALRSFAGRLAGAVVGIAMAFLGYGVWSLVGMQLVSVGAAAGMLWLLADERPRLRLSLARIRDLLGFALASIASNLVWYSNVRLFTLLVGAQLGTAAVGQFHFGLRIVDALRDTLGGAVHQLALPLFARQQNDLSTLRGIFARAMRLTCLITAPTFAGLAATTPEIVAAVFGERWAPAVPVIQLLALGAIPSFMLMYASTAMNARGYPALDLWANLVGLAVSLGGIALFGHLGLVVAAAVWLFRALAMLPVSAAFLYRVPAIPLGQQLAPTLVPLAAAAMTFLAVSATRELLPAVWPTELRLVALVAAGAAVYGLAIIALKRDLLPELFRFLADGRRRRAGGAV